MSILTTQDAFFAAMNEGGWAAEGPSPHSRPMMDVELRPGYKGIKWAKLEWTVTDEWIQIPDVSRSAGITTIYQAGIPVWIMHYGGWYPDDIIPVVQRALRAAYKAARFYGGRGPESFLEGELQYTNCLVDNRFSAFQGTEYVHDAQKKLRGFHTYFGFALL